MDIFDIFEKASKKNLRFNYKGVCTVEDLWVAPLTDLDTMHRLLSADIRASEEESLLEKKSDNLSDIRLQVGIIKRIVEVRLEEKDAKLKRVAKAARKQKILSIMDKKEDSSLEDMSREDLAKLLED